ncbi:MAG TPA: hydroxyphenylacetyl-CoA thioesterase PaaI [Acetobacteraceae bacterium]|nr:hydroxyphenylacetyl-CoA thioesterase PaaI [Acetobacteraceae bacterium]
MNELVSAQAEAMWQADRASRGLGMRLEAAAPGRARLSMTVTEAMANGHGICHGGFIFTLADSAMAFASNRHGDAAVAQHAAIAFIRPGRIGEVLVAEAVERMRTGRSGMYDIRVSTADGALVAEFRGHTRTLRGNREAENNAGGT